MADTQASSETQGQLVGAGKDLNGREKNSGEEKSRTRVRAPGDTLLRAHLSISLLSYAVATQEQFHFRSAKIFSRAFFRRRLVADSSRRWLFLNSWIREA